MQMYKMLISYVSGVPSDDPSLYLFNKSFLQLNTFSVHELQFHRFISECFVSISFLF